MACPNAGGLISTAWKPHPRDAFAEAGRAVLGQAGWGTLLNFFIEDIGPAIYNQGVVDAQTRMQLRVADLPGELYADEFQYWSRLEARRKSRR